VQLHLQVSILFHTLLSAIGSGVYSTKYNRLPFTSFTLVYSVPATLPVVSSRAVGIWAAPAEGFFSGQRQYFRQKALKKHSKIIYLSTFLLLAWWKLFPE
jgi:hypothetical protein